MPELYPEDQKRVDEYLARSVRSERKPFRPLLLLMVILAMLVVLTGIAYFIGQSEGLV
ncbi:hypothetical protein TDB9533_01455 [Thalassocella blandensis]|nr:hypothetical protein TDB9533_01455 [Thalassocella blandensis]